MKIGDRCEVDEALEGPDSSKLGHPTAQHIQHPAMRFQVAPVATSPTESPDGFFKMREWQGRCFTELENSHHWIINAPMAAGKSFQICAMAAQWLRRDPNLRVVIAVPQTIIAAGFRKNKIELPDGFRIEWCVKSHHDLCGETANQSTTRLLQFLSNTSSCDLMDRVILCTHATVVRAFKAKKTAFHRVLLVIDEAHHIKQGVDEETGLEIDNQLGALAKYSLRNPHLIQLGLTTATFFRGDRTPVVSDVRPFTRFDLRYDEYLATCEYLRSFSYDFVLHAGSFIDPLKRLFDLRIGKTLVYIPAVNSRGSLGTKTEDVTAVLRAIAGTDAPLIADADEPVMRVRRGQRWVRVVNLVGEEGRERKKQAIFEDHERQDASEIDVVIALGMFKEGANWKWADREIIVGQRGSLTEIIQIIGRLFRDAIGKTHVEAYQIFPFALDQMDKDEIRESLNDYLKAILLSLLLENVLTPIMLPVPPDDEVEGAPVHDGEDDRRRIDHLREVLGNDGRQIEALHEITARVRDAIAIDAALRNVDQLREPLQQIVADVLSAYGVGDRHEEVAEQVLRMFERRTALLNGLNVGDIPLDILRENPFGCLLRYTSDACGIATFQELRAATRSYAFLGFEEARAFVHSLGLKSVTEWEEHVGSGEKRDDIPKAPQITYQELGWKGFGDWLGTDTIRTNNRIYRSYPEAQLFVLGLQLKSQREWTEYCQSGKKPHDIPAAPHSIYEKCGWTTLGDWLGTRRTPTRERTYLTFDKAQHFVHTLKLNSYADWQRYCGTGKKPENIPANPSLVYRDDGWSSTGDWLGTGKIAAAKRSVRPFKEARLFVHTLGLKSHKEWMQFYKSGERPDDIPSNPSRNYKDHGWTGWGDWLGTGTPSSRKPRFPLLQSG